MQKITPFLWFDGRAEEAAKFYTSIFKNSKITSLKYWSESSPFPSNQVMTVTFELDGLQIHAFDAGPQFKFNESISLLVDCSTQDEVDELWERLSAGGSKNVCGWLKDKFGVSWQITPRILMETMADPDPDKAARVLAAMMKMDKIIIADVQAAYEGK